VQPAAQAEAPAVQNVATHSSEDVTTNAFQAAAQQVVADGDVPAEEDELVAVPQGPPATPPRTKQQTVVNDEWSKTGRNEPCPCGSGKKFKLCHGR
jgi:preprotein translocase subunit SecA